LLVYISKTDVIDEEKYKELRKEYNAFIDAKKLKEKLIKFL